MLQHPDWPTVVCALGFVAGNTFALALWIYGAFRTGLWFCYLMILVAAFGIVLAVVNTIIYYNPASIYHALGSALYHIVFYGYIYALLGNSVLSLAGLTFIVLWMVKARDSLNRSNQSLEQ